MAANRPYTAYGQSAYYATAPAQAPPPGAVAATPIPGATTVPSYATGYDTSTGYSNYYYDSNSYNYIQYPAQTAAVAAAGVPTAVSQWSAAPAAVAPTTAGYSTPTTGLIYGTPAPPHHHHRPPGAITAAPPAINHAATAAYSTPTADPWKPVQVDYSQSPAGYTRGRGRSHTIRGASSSQVANQPTGFGGGYTGAPGAPSSLSSALLASAAGGGATGTHGTGGTGIPGRGGRGGRGGGMRGAGRGGGMNRGGPPKPQVVHCANIEEFIKQGLRGQHPTGWVQEKARKNSWHVDGKEGSGEKGYSYDLIIAELSAKGIARKKKDAKTNAFRQMAVKLAIKLNVLPPQGDEEQLQKKIDQAMEMDHQVVVVSKPEDEVKIKVEKKPVSAASAVLPPPVVTAGPVTLPSEATQIPKEIPKFTDEELSRFPGKAVTLLIEALRLQGNIQPIFTSVNEERMPKHGNGMPRTEFTCKAKYIIHGTVYCYYGRAFNKKCAKEQASAFAYLGLTSKSFKEFTGQEAKDPLLKDKAAPCIVYQQQQPITVVGSEVHSWSSKINLPAGGKKEVPVASVAPTPQAVYQPPAPGAPGVASTPADTRQQLKRPANVNVQYGMANKFRKY